MNNNVLPGERCLPPYGPTRGMMQGLQLMQRMTPTKVDSEFLRANRIAPGNEYKVVGALRFLGLVDEDGKPTEESRLLKTRGPTYTLALQNLVKTAYSGLFTQITPDKVSREFIYNYFVTEAGMGAEMANKATRFFLSLCRLADIELGPSLTGHLPPSKAVPRPRQKGKRRVSRHKAQSQSLAEIPTLPGLPSPIVITITPEMASMGLDEMTELFRKIKLALRRAFLDEK